MAEDAITADRTVAVYCGRGGSFSVPYRQGEPASAFFDAVVDRLRTSLTWAHVTVADIVLWRVPSTDDLKALYIGERAAERLDPALSLRPWATVTADTFAPSHAIWVERFGGISGGSGEWGAVTGECPRGRGARRQTNPARRALTHAARAVCTPDAPVS